MHVNSISLAVSVENEKNRETSSAFFKTICHQLREHSGIWYMLAANAIFSCGIFSLKLIPADMFDIMIVRFFIQFMVFGGFATFYRLCKRLRMP